MSKNTDIRINKIIGQLEGLKRELSKDNYDCEQVMQQFKAATGAMKSLGRQVVIQDLKQCTSNGMSVEDREIRIESLLSAAFS